MRTFGIKILDDHKQRERLLEAIAELGDFSKACASVGVGRRTFNRYKEDDKAMGGDFEQQCLDAKAAHKVAQRVKYNSVLKSAVYNEVVRRVTSGKITDAALISLYNNVFAQ